MFSLDTYAYIQYSAKNFVKYYPRIEILDTSKGMEMFDSVLGTALRPNDVLLNAARFVLGNNTSDEDAKTFLQKKIPKALKLKGNRVSSYLSQGQSRGIDVVRGAFVSCLLLKRSTIKVRSTS